MLLINKRVKHSDVNFINIEGRSNTLCKIFKNNSSLDHINLSAIYVPPHKVIQNNYIIVGDLIVNTNTGVVNQQTTIMVKKLYKNLYDCPVA